MRGPGIILATFFLVYGGCIQKESVEWTDELMVEVVVDIHLAEAAAQSLSASIRDTLLPRYYEQVFAIHEISEADFNARMEALQRQPARLKALYEKVDSVFEIRAAEAREN